MGANVPGAFPISWLFFTNLNSGPIKKLLIKWLYPKWSPVKVSLPLILNEDAFTK
jgi:hypothetical protein